jgi:hypothetical protein
MAMRKTLLASTALASAGLLAGGVANAADRLELRVGGYHQQFLSVMDAGLTDATDGTGKRPFDFSRVDNKHNSEICFEGKYKLDNGITVGVNVQLEANTEADQIDESYLFIETDELGRLIVGDENNAAYLMQVTAPHGGLSHNQGNLTSMPNQGPVPLAQGMSDDSTITGTLLRFDDNDSGKFSYISPKFAGFQIGLSYIPNFESGGDNNNSVTRLDSDPGPGTNGNNYGYAASLGFGDKWGDFGLKASLGYLFGNVPGNNRGGSSNLQAASGGLLVSFGGFEVGGSYTWANGDKVTGGVDAVGNGESYDGYGYDVGVAYTFGPYKVGLAYQRGETEGLRQNSSKQHADYIILSGTYRIGPGVDWVTGVYAADIDGEDGVAGANQIREHQMIGASTGLLLSF